MNLEELEIIVIQCLRENLELSGDPIPIITSSTKPAHDFIGFDSLRTIEVLISIEEKVGCELPPEKIFSDKRFEDITVSSIANAIYQIKKEAAPNEQIRDR
ncbi:acyl carrier protein [Nitrosovibrio tenuis]|uniref:Phosphopantetheine attachment site n=1 Tax=Nitrosovibrio tenuis TaxID=1233 RepID=A0A1H7S1A1_9PROT|nr:acyl carrier protein [Nitrosovibrio tenuis]SEL65634.1 Phosphopantetheine attachment site [Nitrosovibrio tenuis]